MSPKRRIGWIREAELRRRLRASRIARLLGFELESARPGSVVLRMRVQRRHLQIEGVVHGGFVAALADTAGGLLMYLSTPRGTRVATVELKVNYLEPISRGILHADARPLRVGRSLAVVDCEVFTERGQLAGKALMTFSLALTRRKNPAR